MSKSKTKKVLILDPEYKAREVLRRMLGNLPEVQVQDCFDAFSDALRHTKNAMPDVVFIALEMIKDRKETEWLRELSKYTRIIVTAYYFDPLLKHLEKYTAGYLFKPVDIDELKSKMGV